MQGRGFRLFLVAKAEGVDNVAAPNLIAFGDVTAKPCPLVAGQWSESFIKEIPMAAIDLTDYDLFYGLTEASEYFVTFDLDGGTMALPHSIAINYDTVVSKPAVDPTREGYTFDGWYNGETLYDFDDAVTEDLTLTAAWLEVFTITFDSDGGSAVASQNVSDGDTATEPTPAPTFAGHTFEHWSLTEDGAAFNFTTAIIEDLTLYAIWQII